MDLSTDTNKPGRETQHEADSAASNIPRNDIVDTPISSRSNRTLTEGEEASRAVSENKEAAPSANASGHVSKEDLNVSKDVAADTSAAPEAPAAHAPQEEERPQRSKATVRTPRMHAHLHVN